MILEEYLYPCFYEKMGKKELNLKEKNELTISKQI